MAFERFWKKRAEEELQRSGIDYTIIRPGKFVCFIDEEIDEPYAHPSIPHLAYIQAA